MADLQLKPCPFCGGHAEMVRKQIYLDHGYRVDCTQCGARGTVVLVNHPKFTYYGLDESTRYTEQQAKEKVIEAWNRRADNEKREAD